MNVDVYIALYVYFCHTACLDCSSSEVNYEIERYEFFNFNILLKEHLGALPRLNFLRYMLGFHMLSRSQLGFGYGLG